MSRLPQYGERLRLGMILASKNTVAEPDVQAMLPRVWRCTPHA